MNKLVNLIVILLIGALLITTSAMSYDFIQRVLPPGQQYLAFAALAAFGVGAVGWTMFFKQAVGWPKWVALLLIAVDVIGEGTLFMADVYLNSASRFGLDELTGDSANMFLIAFGAVIVINIVGGIMIHVLDPDSLLESHELEEENSRAEAELKIRKIELKAEIDNRKALANAIREKSRTYNQERIPSLLAAWEGGAELKYSQLENALTQGFKPGRGEAAAPHPALPVPAAAPAGLAMAPAPMAAAEKKIGFAMEMLGPQHALHYQSASGQEKTVAVAESIVGLQAIASGDKGRYQSAWITDNTGATIWTAPNVRAEEIVRGGPLPPAK